MAFAGGARLDPRYREVDLLAARTAVVQRDFEGGALKEAGASLLQRCQAGLCLRCCGKGFSAAEAVAGVSAGISAATALAARTGAIRLLRTWALRVGTCGTHSPLRTRQLGRIPQRGTACPTVGGRTARTYGPGVGHSARTPTSRTAIQGVRPVSRPRCMGRAESGSSHVTDTLPAPLRPRTLTPRPRGLPGRTGCACQVHVGGLGTRNCDTRPPRVRAWSLVKVAPTPRSAAEEHIETPRASVAWTTTKSGSTEPGTGTSHSPWPPSPT